MNVPLDGITVVVTGDSVAATMCGVLLGEYGADVVKVESPGTGDPLRTLAPFAEGRSLRWTTMGRGLRSVTCDHTHAAGRALLARLLADADVICDGFGGDTFATLGFVGAAPGAVVLRMSALGSHTDVESSTADGLLGAAAGGLLHITGYPDGPPIALGSDVVDHLTAAYAAQAAMAGLLARRRSGSGCTIEATTTGSVMRIIEWTVLAHAADGRIRMREGNSPSAVAPIGLFQASDGEHVGIIGASDANFGRLVQTMARPDLLTDERFATGPLRARHAVDINGIVGAWVAGAPSHEILSRCRGGGVIAAVVRQVADIVADEHVAARGDLVHITSDGGVAVLQPAPQPHTTMHRTQLRVAAALGGDNEAVWIGRVGLSPDELAGLASRGVV